MFPSIVSIISGFWGSFVITVMDLYCLPVLPLESKVARIVVDFPGSIAFSPKVTAVHPQLAFVLRMNNVLLPVFVRVKSQFTFSPCLISPKWISFLSSEIIGAFASSFLLS